MDIKLFDSAFAAIPEAFKKASPICAMVLGSGWNTAVNQLEVLAEISYSDIPNFGGATVIGHTIPDSSQFCSMIAAIHLLTPIP